MCNDRINIAHRLHSTPVYPNTTSMKIFITTVQYDSKTIIYYTQQDRAEVSQGPEQNNFLFGNRYLRNRSLTSTKIF